MRYTQRTETVLVTGTSSGFGFETSRLLAQLGYRVFATMRNPERDGPRLVDAARNGAGEIVLRELDVTKPDQVESVVAEAAERGDLEAVVNNAGIAIYGFFEDLSEEEIRETFETNFFGLVRITKAALPHLRERRRGSIVQISSIGGRVVLPTLAAYGASKHAVEGISEAMRHELKPLGIRVVLIEPGGYKTEMFAGKKIVAKGLSAGDSRNAPVMEKLDARVEKAIVRIGGDPKHVARKIAAVIESPHPRLRHSLGPDAKPAILAGDYLPFGLFERIVHRVLKSAGYPPAPGTSG